ncbi:MAG: hypothetical protein NW202_13575 [Nitrospira sp.]|nr:hypothetical protein [Nitrospira sp.]
MNIDWAELRSFVLVVAVATMIVGSVAFGVFGFVSKQRQPQHACPLPPTSPSTGPVTVEWTHGDGKVTVQLGGAGFPIVADPGTGKRWILMPVKED